MLTYTVLWCCANLYRVVVSLLDTLLQSSVLCCAAVPCVLRECTVLCCAVLYCALAPCYVLALVLARAVAAVAVCYVLALCAVLCLHCAVL